MGGNKGKRTKGNVKPSSSGRTAELLSASGVTGFVGFSGVTTDLPGYVAPSGKSVELEEIDISVDNDFRLVLKKSTKRDAVTKVKALQEFSELCQSKDLEDVKSALPFWPKTYNRLAIDHDRRVREVCQLAHKSLLARVKKCIAPYLKSLMGAWLVSICDLHAPSASAANVAFQLAFPEKKQTEALEFCKDDIFKYIEDSLFHETPATLSDPKCEKEEMESKYNRLLSSSLNAMRKFLVISNTQNESSKILFEKILDENKFWKLAKHRETEVRRAFYSVFVALIGFYPQLVNDKAAKICPLTLIRLGEEDNPMVAPPLWDLSLHLMVSLENCWEHINFHLGFLPQLLLTLNNGGSGNARNTFQNLLPMLSKMPQDVLGKEFYEKFFGAFVQGMKNEKVLASRSELSAVCSAYFDCLEYLLLISGEEENELRKFLITKQLVPLLKDSLLQDLFILQAQLFCDLGVFLRQLDSKKSKDSSKSALAKHCLELFSSEFFGVIYGLLDNNFTEGLLKRISLLFQSLYCSKPLKTSVQFKVDNELIPKTIHSNSISFTENSAMTQGTIRLCCTIYRRLDEKKTLACLKLFSELVKTAPSLQLFSNLLEIPNTELKPEKNKSSPLKFTCLVLTPWINQRKELFGEERISLQCLVSLALSACSCLDQKDSSQLLEEITQGEDLPVLESLMVQGSETDVPRLRSWLKGSFVGEKMVKLSQIMAKRFEDQSDVPTKEDVMTRMIKICFSATKDFETLISSEHLNLILSTLTKSLSRLNSQGNPEAANRIVQLVCDLASDLFRSCHGCWLLPAVESLLIRLFKLSILWNGLGLEAPPQLRDTWFLGVTKLVELKGVEFEEEGFLIQSALAIKEFLGKGMSFDKVIHLQQINNLFVTLLNACSVGLHLKQDGREGEWVDQAIQCILPLPKAWQEMQEDLFQRLEIPVLGVSDSYQKPILEILSLSETCHPFLVWSFFASTLLTSAQNRKVIYEDKEWDLVSGTDKGLEQLPKHLYRIYAAAGIMSKAHISSKIPSDHPVRFFSSDILAMNLISCLMSSDLEIFLSLLGQRSFSGSLVDSQALQAIEENTLKDFNWCSKFMIDQNGDELILQEIQPVLTSFRCWSGSLKATFIANLLNKSLSHIVSKDIQVEGLYYLTVANECLNSQRPDIFAMESVQENVKLLMEYLSGLKAQENDIFNPKWEEKINLVTQVASTFIMVVNHFPHLIPQESWDTILLTLVGWIERCKELKELLLDEMSLPCTLVFSLLNTVQRVFNQSRFELVQSLTTEWEELYAENVYPTVLSLFMDLSSKGIGKKLSFSTEMVLLSIAQTLKYITPELTLKYLDFVSTNIAGSSSTIEVKYDPLLTKLYNILVSGNRTLVFGSHTILYNLMAKLPQTQSSEEPVDKEEEKERPPPDALLSTLKSSGVVVEALLTQFPISDCCLSIAPYTDSFNYTLHYLFSWLQLLKLFGAAPSEIRSEFAVYLRDSKLLDLLLQSLFRLMPINPQLTADPLSKGGNQMKTMFTEPFKIKLESPPNYAELQHLSCQVYLQTLTQLPALVRQWWHNQEKRTAEIVNKFTSSHVSPCISMQEILAVQNTDIKFSNMTVKARPMSREVVSRYSMEEVTIELVVRLPSNHPLGPVMVEAGHRVGVGMTQWRNWLLQLTTYLTHQNGSILEGLSLWKRNVDKRFEGVEECMICFSVLHGTTCHFPKLTCRTCKKRYHSACLYKWFNTSQNSTCPLCRNLF